MCTIQIKYKKKIETKILKDKTINRHFCIFFVLFILLYYHLYNTYINLSFLSLTHFLMFRSQPCIYDIPVLAYVYNSASVYMYECCQAIKIKTLTWHCKWSMNINLYIWVERTAFGTKYFLCLPTSTFYFIVLYRFLILFWNKFYILLLLLLSYYCNL